MKPEHYSERVTEIEGWPVTIIQYKLGDVFHTKIENNFTHGWTSRATGPTRDEAERKAVELARTKLANTRRMTV